MARQAAATLTRALVLATAYTVALVGQGWAFNADGLPSWQAQALQREQPSRPHAESAEGAAQTDEQRPVAAPPGSHLETTQNRQPVGSENEQDRAQAGGPAPSPTDVVQAEAAQSQARSAFVVMWFTILLTIATIAQGSFTGIQLYFNRIATHAAKSSADIARSALVLTQRARIHCEMKVGISKKILLSEQSTLDVTPQWKNTGPTTAKNVSVTAAIYTSSRRISKDVKYKNDPKEIVRADIGAGMIMNGGTQIFTKEQMIKIRDGELYAYVFAYASYDTVFNEVSDRTTLICRQILADSDNPREFLARVAGEFDRSD